MKEFLDELMYMCSSSNSKSRGFYIFIASCLVAMLIGAVVMVVILLINIIKFKAFSFLWLVLLILDIAAFIGVLIWLKRS